MRHPCQLCLSIIAGAAMFGSTVFAEQDAEAVRPHAAPISDTTPRDEKITRCADLLIGLALAPLGFDQQALPDHIDDAIAIAQRYDATKLSFGSAIALAFPNGADTDVIIRDLGARSPQILEKLDQVDTPLNTYFFNIKAEIEAHEDHRTIPSIVTTDLAICRPIADMIIADTHDITELFDLHASRMARWAGALRIKITEDLPLRVRLQRCGAMIYASSTDIAQADGDWMAVPSGARALVYFAMKAVQEPINTASFARNMQSTDGPVRDALAEMAEMTHRYVVNLGYEKSGPNKLDFHEVLQSDRDYCRSQLGEEIMTLGRLADDWPVLQNLPLAHWQ